MTRQNFPYIGAVYAFFIQENQILLLRRANTTYLDGMRGVPSGHMDGKELSTNALIREVSEETNIKLTQQQLQKPITLFRMCSPFPGIDNNERFELFFPITQRDGEIINNEPHKCDALERFDIGNLPANTIPYIKTMIQAYQKGTTLVEINEINGETHNI